MGPDGDLAALRLARGCRCYGVLIDRAVAGYGWLSAGPEWIGEIELEIKPGPAEAYVWNCMTLPEHRRKGIFRSLLHGISIHAREAGLRRLWIGSIDIPAEKALEPSGFAPALHFTSVAFAGLHVARVRAGADRKLAGDATAVLGTGAGVRSWRSHPRRH